MLLKEKVIIAGGTGLIGRCVVEKLRKKNYALVLLTRSPARYEAGKDEEVTAVQWDGISLGAWTSHLENARAVINLSGEPIFGRWWTKKQKQKMIDSRLQSTRVIVQAIGQAQNKPEVLISGSAIGYYGDVASGEVTEQSPGGRGFLAELCEAWESAAKEAEKAGVRSVQLRTGIVLNGEGGALKPMLRAFRWFAGACPGSGKQWFSWIHLEDAAELICFALEEKAVSGPLNVTAPNAVRMLELCRTMGHLLRRPCWGRVPSWFLRIGLGEMSTAIVTGQKVLPQKAAESGYFFRYPDLESALRKILEEQ